MNQEDDALVLGDHAYTSRLLLGTGKFASADVMARAVAASGVQIVTVALRRFDRDRPDDALLTPLLAMEGVTLMPNTSGARNAEEAIQAARIARELCGSRLVKVEIHPNPRHLMPDPIETYEAARVLAADGWLVMPYIPPTRFWPNASKRSAVPRSCRWAQRSAAVRGWPRPSC